jgi:glycosyltransferase involved in cell wall biosynthesis
LKPVILTAIDHYLPGFKGGGPIRSIANLIEWLGDEFDFSVVTRDRDLLDSRPYEGVSAGMWHRVRKARVLYLSPRACSLMAIRRLLNDTSYDLLYLNSFFSRLSIKILTLRRLHLLKTTPVVLAPRGELSPGALAIKRLKKRIYVVLSRSAGFYRGVVWHGSSALEIQDIRSTLVLGREPGVVAPNLPRPFERIASDLPATRHQFVEADTHLEKLPGQLRVIFLSRIARMKNLDYALRVLGHVKGDVLFDIYGPIEDPVYWIECQSLSSKLPRNIVIRYLGSVAPDTIRYVFSRYHVLLFPTRGENFGHVILESLLSGCPVLISDRTPWIHLRERHAGWDLPLSEPNRFSEVLNQLAGMTDRDYTHLRLGARSTGRNFVSDGRIVAANRSLFRDVLRGHP